MLFQVIGVRGFDEVSHPLMQFTTTGERKAGVGHVTSESVFE